MELVKHSNKIKKTVWKGLFQSNILDTIETAVSDVSVSLNNGNVVIIIADKATTVSEKILSKNSKGFVFSNIYELIYTKKTNNTPFVKLAPKVKELLKGVQQKVILLPDVKMNPLIGTSRAVSTMVHLARPIPCKPAATYFFRSVVRCGALVVI
jgi:hypothetical protein